MASPTVKLFEELTSVLFRSKRFSIVRIGDDKVTIWLVIRGRMRVLGLAFGVGSGVQVRVVQGSEL